MIKSSHGTHRRRSQALALTWITAGECDAHLMHFLKLSRRKCGFWIYHLTNMNGQQLHTWFSYLSTNACLLPSCLTQQISIQSSTATKMLSYMKKMNVMVTKWRTLWLTMQWLKCGQFWNLWWWQKVIHVLNSLRLQVVRVRVHHLTQRLKHLD